MIADNSNAYLDEVSKNLNNKPEVVQEHITNSNTNSVVIEEVKTPSVEEQKAFEESLKFEAEPIPMDSISKVAEVPEKTSENRENQATLYTFEKSLKFTNYSDARTSEKILAVKPEIVEKQAVVITPKHSSIRTKSVQKPAHHVKVARVLTPKIQKSETFEEMLNTANPSNLTVIDDESTSAKQQSLKTFDENVNTIKTYSNTPVPIVKHSDKWYQSLSDDLNNHDSVDSLLLKGALHADINRESVSEVEANIQYKMYIATVSDNISPTLHLSRPSNTCENVSVTGKMGGSTREGFIIQGQISVPGDIFSPDCKRLKKKLENQTIAMCEASNLNAKLTGIMYQELHKGSFACEKLLRKKQRNNS